MIQKGIIDWLRVAQLVHGTCMYRMTKAELCWKVALIRGAAVLSESKVS